MKQKLQKFRTLRLRWRILLILVGVFGVLVPAALAVDSTWWGSADGDYGSKNDHNYIVHPPADAKPDYTQDGTRLQFNLHKFLDSTAAGVSAAYLPHQYLVTSSQPKLTFEMRGGYWDKSNCQGDDGTSGNCSNPDYRDRYDRRPSNPAWVVNFTKQQGYLSPFYYEVYQLYNGNPHDGRLLGVINPRDRNVFPTADNGPKTNTDCTYVGGNTSGPCWRTFNVDTNGGLITVGGTPGQTQDSCASRAGTGNQCLGQQFALGGSTLASAVVGDKTPVQKPAQRDVASALSKPLWDTSFKNNESADTFAWRVPPDGDRPAKTVDPIVAMLTGYADGAKSFITGEAVQAAGTHQITVWVNPTGRTPGNVTVTTGGCTDNSKVVNGSGNVTFGGCSNDTGHTISVSPGAFRDGNGPCGINDQNQSVGASSSNQTVFFTYTCSTHQIRVIVTPTRDDGSGKAITGGNVTVKIYDNTHPAANCVGTGGGTDSNGNSYVWKTVGSDGTATFGSCLDGDNYTAAVSEDQFTDTAGNPNYYCTIGGNPKSVAVGGDNQATLGYFCSAIKVNDGGIVGNGYNASIAINSGVFLPVDNGSNGRFNSATQPNLNGNYVFLIKQVAYTDIAHGYVSDYERLILNSGYWGAGVNFGYYSAGCSLPATNNTLTCPNELLTEADNHNNDKLVQNGYYLRTPKTVDNNPNSREYIASAPTKWAFNFNYGPTSPEGQNYEAENYGNYTGLHFQSGGMQCRALYKQRIPNADWDNDKQFESGSSFDKDIGASVTRLGTVDDNGNQTSLSNESYPVNTVNVSADWKISTSNNLQSQILVNFPGYPNASQDYWPGGYPNYPFGPGSQNYFRTPWQNGNFQGNEHFTGQLTISGWDDGNNLIVGGMPFTWGFWPTCDKPSINQITPRAATNYVYNGQDPETSPGLRTINSQLNFAFNYTFQDFKARTQWDVQVRDPATGGIVRDTGNQFDNSVSSGSTFHNPGFNLSDFTPSKNYQWRACATATATAGDTTYDGGQWACGNWTDFQLNFGPRATIVSANATTPTNTGTVNYNCAKLAAVLSDQGTVTPRLQGHFVVRWSANGQDNVMVSTTSGQIANGGTVTSDQVSPSLWYVTQNGVTTANPVPSKTLTQFLQQDVPEGVNVSWWVQGNDRYGASDLTFGLYSSGNPSAINNESRDNPSADPNQNQVVLDYFKPGPAASATFHKDTRPQFNTATSTKKFYDTNGTPVPFDSVVDGQTVEVRTTIKNVGETPTKRYGFADYIGSARDFEQPMGGSFKIGYNLPAGATRDDMTQADPTVSMVIPDHQNGYNDQLANSISVTGATGGAGSGAIGDTGGGGGGAIGGGTPTEGGPAGDIGGQGADVSGLFAILNGQGYATTGPGAGGGADSTNANAKNGGNATGFGSGGGGAGWYGGNGGNGSYGGGGGGAAGYSTSNKTGGTGGGGAVVFAPVGASNVVRTTGTSWTVPAGVTSVKVWAIGAGGGGAGATTADGSSGGAGGAGGVVYRTFTVAPGDTVSYSLGAGGAGGTGAVNGTSGGSTVVTSGVTTITATGGAGGAYNSGAVGAGGTISGTSTAGSTTQSLSQQSYKVDFGMNGSGAGLRSGELAPGETITVSYLVRANRNQAAGTSVDANANYNRRLPVGSTANPLPTPQPDARGGTVDIGDAHVFLPFSEDYCNAANPLINHTLEFKPGDVLAPWLRSQRGDVHSNDTILGYDGVGGNATFVVTANGALAHFTSDAGANGQIGNYNAGSQVATGSCTANPNGIDWRTAMDRNINTLLAGSYNSNLGALTNPGGGTPRGRLGTNSVWVVGGPGQSPNSLTLNSPINWDGVGTIVVFGDLNITADQAYANTGSSVGFIVLGNLNIDPGVTKVVGSFYVSDVKWTGIGAQPTLANGCPNIDTSGARGMVSTGSANAQLNVDGLIVAGGFNLQRYFVDPSDTTVDPAENVYYDGRVVSNTPPGFSTFRNTAAWYEIAP